MTLEEFNELLTKQVEKYLTDKFTWRTVPKWIESIVKARLEDIVRASLGFKKERWHGEGWEVATSDTSNGLIVTIKAMVHSLVEEKLKGLLDEAKKDIEARIDAAETKKRIMDAYDSAFSSASYERIRRWAQETAEKDVKAIFEGEMKPLLEEARFRAPLVRDSLVAAILAPEKEET